MTTDVRHTPRQPRKRLAGAPSRRRPTRAMLFAVFVFSTSAGWHRPAHAEPSVPTSDAEVLEQLPVAQDPTAATLRRLHAALARQPDNLDLALEVARRDIVAARARFDPRFNGYAQAALRPWWDQPRPPASVRLLRGIVRQSNHAFDAALTDLDAVIAADPRAAQALLSRAVVHQVRAEYTAAATDCQSVAGLVQGLTPLVCTAGVRGLGSDAAAARESLAHGYDTLGPRASRDIRVWALTLLAELAARLDDSLDAERRFRDAIALDPHDGYLLGAYADFLLDHDRPRDVVALLADQTRIDPLLLRLAIAEQRIDPASATGHIADLADRFAASTARGETVHQREEARFTLTVLGQTGRALRLAQANWLVQREPADARILLEAALAAKSPSAAVPVLTWLDDTGLPDARLRGLAAAVRALPPEPAPTTKGPV